MSFDNHNMNFLRFARKRGNPFGRVATMGRQGMPGGGYCENFLLENFGASLVESFDYSDFEGATNIVDLNEPIYEHGEKYDTIIDFGTMEHVFNASQGLKNVTRLCAPGGQIIHSLPANNFCNHGFWQFSPELFFSLYSDKNGYSETEIFLADV